MGFDKTLCESFDPRSVYLNNRLNQVFLLVKKLLSSRFVTHSEVFSSTIQVLLAEIK